MVNRFLPDLTGFRGVFRLLCVESAFGMAYETWISPAYLSGLAGQLKVSLVLISILAAMPCVGATGQIVGAWAFDRTTSVKRYVLGIACIGRAVWLVPLLFALVGGLRTYLFGIPFPVSTWFILAAICTCISSFLTAMSTNAWMHWMQDIIPARFQGRFFGSRQRFTTGAFIFASVVAATLLGWRVSHYLLGPAVLCILALIAGAISIYLHSHIKDIPHPPSSEGTSSGIIEIIKSTLYNENFRRLLFFGMAFNGTISVGGSYFPYYFTKELNISMSSVVLWSGIESLGCFLAASYWGRRVDRVRSPFEIMWLTGHVVAFLPLLFLIKSSKVVQFIAPFEYLLNGLAWSGFTLAQTKILLKIVPPRKATRYFSVYAAACGLSSALNTFCAGQFVQIVGGVDGFRVLWFVMSAFRFLILWTLCRPLIAEAKIIRNVLPIKLPPTWKKILSA